jgi:putative Ca2+/H+ antiporter (TMEM165/GDT1 family)
MTTTPSGSTPPEGPSAPAPAVSVPAAAAAAGAAAIPEPAITSAEPPRAWLTVFFSTATTVFLAELGDKTQLAALLLSAESGRPAVVFVGASLALISSSLVGVLLGRWLSTLLPPAQLERGAGVLMVALGLWLGRQAVLHLAPVATAAS